MSDFRIVHNPQTGEYRIERRGLFGWSFLMDRQRQEYLSFGDFEAARSHLCGLRRRDAQPHRRWRILDLCGC